MKDDVGIHLARLQSETPVLLATYDPDDRLQYANAAFRAAFSLQPDETPLWSEIIRRGQAQRRGLVIRDSHFESWLSATLSRRGKTSYRAFEMDLVDGRWFWMTETVDADGWMLCVASEITSMRTGRRELRQARDFALKASQTDDLTGIANRRFMMQALAGVSEAVARGDFSSGCLCIFDLDRFKNINDDYGHQIGDHVLQNLALVVLPIVRRRDSFGRIGGEEFMLIMPDTKLPQATHIVNDFLSIIRRARPVPSLPNLSCTCSAGLAEVAKDDTVSGLYTRADRALYLAKIEGRDRLNIAA